MGQPNLRDHRVGLFCRMKDIVWLVLLTASLVRSVQVWEGTRRGPPGNVVSSVRSRSDFTDPKHGVKMGVANGYCDDGQTNLTLDWDNSPINFTCYTVRLTPEMDTKAFIEFENIPKYYSAMHACMNESIAYQQAIPTYGTHRPLWPRYGEYRFLPAQRWVHSLEHGAVVMLYHPCADLAQVYRLRSVLRGCLRRHIVTPSTQLSAQRPLALVAWGVRLTMSWVDQDLVVSFIRQNALHGPEQVSRDGQFDFGLLVAAETVSDFNDYILCPTV